MEPGATSEPAGACERTLADGSRDWLIREEPLVLEVAGREVLTMRTPGDDEHLALGFLLTEGAVERAADIAGCRSIPGAPAEGRADRLVVEAAVEPDRLRRQLTRSHEIRSSCGICGLADPAELLDDLRPLLPGTPRLPRGKIAELRETFEGGQALFARTGAAHAAAVFAADGTLLGKGEDVGRHNALDKAVGAAARAGAELSRSIAMLSGRAGFDLVLKCMRVRIPMVLSVSAPSAHSHDLCLAAGATLVGFVRADRMQVYTDGGRLGD